MRKAYSLESFPQFANDIIESQKKLMQLISEVVKTPEPDRWLTLDELVEYDPLKRSKQTFYRLTHRGEIPHFKSGKRLTFIKSEIDEWLKSSCKVSLDDLNNKN